MTQEEEIIVIPGRWDLPFRHTAGRVASRFFHGLKAKRILALRCPRCQRVLMPPRPFCERCFQPLDDWVEVGQQGTLEAFTICYARFTGLPDPPYCLILVKLDGADSALQHLLGEVALEDVQSATQRIQIGMRLEALWREEREGGIKDIKYFRPVA
ncbi:MAG: Zn-ribbon domain-containing OB-fold protein [Chloroflexi bacterium]|nr:Zn-ribbon domain-containing OB-fold protein [Chloroflexota bacterium]